MRITRAAKVAAFPLTALVLVALIACQGPAGPAGAAGDKGDTGATGGKGDPGSDGKDGADAPIPLTGRAGDIVIDSLNAGNDEDEATEFTIDLHAAGYFNGGEAPITYQVTRVSDSDGSEITPGSGQHVVTAEIDDGNKLKLQLNNSGFDQDVDYSTGFAVALSAEDANKESAVTTLVIKPNRAPRLASNVSFESTGPALGDPNDAYVIGIMADEIDADANTTGTQPRTDGAASCATMNSCVITLFTDEDTKDLKVMVTNPGSSYSWSDEGEGKLKLTGLSRTDDPVRVDVTATDKGGLDFKARFTLDVNGPPTLSENAADLSRSVEVTLPTDKNLFADDAAARGVFEDPDGDTVLVTYESSNESVVVVDDSGVPVVLKPKAAGTATVTAIGTAGTVSNQAGLGQYAKITFTVTVK